MLDDRSPLAAEANAAHDSAGPAPALVGPHAVIHAVAVMTEQLGKEATHAVLANAQISEVPSGEEMIPEIDALRLHRWLALREPVECMAIADEAARRTADYIIANRMPSAAVWLLPRMPASLAARMLMGAIRRHAWTFIGAGRFEPHGSWSFTIDRSAADDPIIPPDSLFEWYAAVFTQLYRRLVDPSAHCEITLSDTSTLSVCHYQILTSD